MARPRTERERRRRAFLHALGAGRSVTEAADHAGIAWSTLYSWRQSAAAFRAAWDRAAARARDALADRLRAALIERAVVGIDEPVFHNGQRVGYRKRYSDALLIAGLRAVAPPAAAAAAAAPQPPVVVVRQFTLPPGQEPDGGPARTDPARTERIEIAPAASISTPSEPPALPEPPAPAEPEPDPTAERALRWDHLGRREDM